MKENIPNLYFLGKSKMHINTEAFPPLLNINCPEFRKVNLWMEILPKCITFFSIFFVGVH